MSSDLMLTCVSRDEIANGVRHEKCVFVDEASMGCPWHEFGKLLGSHDGTVISEEFIVRVHHWFTVLPKHEKADMEKIATWLRSHMGECLEFECW